MSVRNAADCRHVSESKKYTVPFKTIASFRYKIEAKQDDEGSVSSLHSTFNLFQENQMADCCNDKACEIETLRNRQSSTLKIVLGINTVMFIVELTAGLIGGSVSLVADSLDMLGDALVYGFSIYVVARGARMKANAALFKGGIMATFGFFALGQAVYKIVFPEVPIFEAIGAIGLLALAANSICLALLWRHRADDINMSSVWLCSRNDIIANVSILFAAAGVWFTHTGWPDILVGLSIAALFLRSALFVLRGAIAELRATNA